MSAIELFPWGLLLIVLGAYIALVVALVVMGRGRQARAVAGFIPDCLVMVRRLIADPHTSRAQRVALVILLAYLISPLDLVPDFLPIVGQADDAVIVALALRLLLRGRGEAAIRAAWPGPESSLRVILAVAGVGHGRPPHEVNL